VTQAFRKRQPDMVRSIKQLVQDRRETRAECKTRKKKPVDGPIFTLDQLKPVARAQGLSDTHLRFLISSLASAEWIEIIKRGTYVVKSPLYSGEISPFAIAAALIQPMAISHWSALSHHGFTTQSPTIVQASTSKKVVTPEMRKGKAHSPWGRAIWHANGLDIEFIHVNQKLFWGFEKIWVNSWQKVNITDPERTAQDLIARPAILGEYRQPLKSWRMPWDKLR
jgi:predicted transcriptional regulator of viral defense system